jgi:hypothetical protein
MLPLAYLGLRYNYRFALQQATRQSETNELTIQYRLLLACLLIGVLMALINQWLPGLLISLLLIIVAARIAKHRVTVLAARSRGKYVCVGKPTIWATPLFIAWALTLALLAVAPIFDSISP